MTQVIVAARGGPGCKLRLADVFDAEQRTALTVAMLRDVLDAVGHTPRVSGIWVVTPTPELMQVARERGAQIVCQSDGGLNAGFNIALQAVNTSAAGDAVALLPGDLPTLDPAELEATLALADTHAVVIAAARRGGTGALVLRGAGGFAPTFGADSFRRHRGQALCGGYAFATVEALSIARDLDEPDDIATILDARRTGITTACLRRFEAQAKISDATHH